MTQPIHNDLTPEQARNNPFIRKIKTLEEYKPDQGVMDELIEKPMQEAFKVFQKDKQ